MPEPAWLPLYDDLIAQVPGLSRLGKTMPYTSVNGHMFSFMTAEGELALRLPDEAREYVMDRFGAAPCFQHGRPMKDYVVVPEALWSNQEALAGCFKASHAYVRGLKPKPTKQ